jgi:AcrR family transcriptional regulator
VPEDKRQLILAAAVRVFARKGYHTCRVGDIAEEAGVAHGLLYHYFDSKDELLETIFRNTWTLMIETIKGVEALEEILTGWVMGQLPDSDEDVRLAERTVVEMLCDGLLTASPARA